MKKANTFLVVGAVCLLSSCAPRALEKNSCIEPATTFAYRADEKNPPYPGEDVPPPNPWVIEKTISLETPELLAVRNIGNDVTEFWIWDMFEPTDSPRQIYVFRTDIESWKPVTLDVNLLSATLPILRLYVLSDNSVWTVHDDWGKTDVSILGRYDEATEAIKPVRKLEKIKDTYSSRIIVVLDSKKDIFWILVPRDSIYSYDPLTDNLTRHIVIPDLDPRDATIAPNGEMYILNNDQSLEQTNVLFLYSPQTVTIENIFYRLEPQLYSSNLLVDHAGRLWIGSLGWMEKDDIWYQTIRSPLFVTTNLDLDGGRVYRWLPPTIELESPDDIFWFRGPNGMFSLDFQKGEWCWFTTYQSNIVEDSEHNLWMLAGGKLYKRPPLP